ncbi:hydrogen gas-evolving membrane-bound hydrogenase subunit E [Catalinimonas niigatensis]|uniref:hydrogen gas-evolving membrane-bound hydrogenase subunit E n=1 Tax=Catalinimonas niigatensis TaxID=1397264 RepID=UPI0026662FDF|nr:hydrogen gas-evolving membrane-bound hydrogenase subunit E [Catalinimonas niigatensis]WPP52154.1 hydrogen gas-evolving membrane-bound hydrogenase subunit E [Catalinimonas niigatensis]
MLLAVLSGYLLALFCAIFYRRSPKLIGYLVTVAVAALCAYFFSFWGEIDFQNAQSFTYLWVPSLGVDLVFYLDGLSLFFSLLITFFGVLILLYSIGYMKGEEHANRFFAFMLIFMASMLGLVLSGNLIQLYIFWELTSISSFLLIGYKSEKDEARQSALQALLVTAGGGLALLTAFILISMSAESFTMAEVLNTNLHESPYLTAIIILVFLASFTKSAQFPFHFWLPNAMAAPTPVSAYLHSATMVKAGVFLLFRFQPMLSDAPVWPVTLMLVGCITMLIGAVLAIVQTDLKCMLAYITISSLGLMVMSIGEGSETALKAALVYLLAHAFYKATLFFVAGNIDHATGTKDIRKLSGLAPKMPYTTAAAVLACISMAGIPPALGFIGKEKLYESTLHASLPALPWLLTGAAFISSVLYVVIALMIGYGLFFSSSEPDTPKPPHTAPFPMWIGPLLLGIGGVAFGLVNEGLNKNLLQPAIQEIIGKESELSLGLWHGFNLVLLLSICTLAVGWLIYLYRHTLIKLLSFTHKAYTLSPEALYFRALDGLDWWATRQTKLLQNGYLRNYIATIVLFFSGLVAYLYFSYQLYPEKIPDLAPITPSRIYEFIPIVLILIGVINIYRTNSRLIMLVSTSMLGFGVATIFIFFSAPDVSMTQFLVETVTLLFFMLIIHRLPKNRLFNNNPRRLFHIGIAAAFGCMMTLILLSVESVDIASKFKEYYLENSVEIGKGHNVVNVILIDFRALDTLGEIVVLCITALGITALNHLNLKQQEK